MEQVTIGLVLVAVVAVVAFVVSRRRPDAPTQGVGRAPAQISRLDFDRPDARWLLVLFSSATCDSCATARARLADVDDNHDNPSAGRVARTEVTWEQDRALHERYGIDGVPLIVLADEHGVVRASVVGVPKPGEIDEVLASLGRPESRS